MVEFRESGTKPVRYGQWMRVWCSPDCREKNCDLNPGRGIRDRMGPHAPSLRLCAPLALPDAPSKTALLSFPIGNGNR